jgi:hypothetical protein
MMNGESLALPARASEGKWVNDACQDKWIDGRLVFSLDSLEIFAEGIKALCDKVDPGHKCGKVTLDSANERMNE